MRGAGGAVAEKDKGAYPEVYDALVALRKFAEPLSPAAMAQHPLLIQLLGEGDVPAAAGALKNLMLANRDDRDIEALLLVMGSGGSVLDRLQSAADQLFVDQRQVRRLADAGLFKIAHAIGGYDFSKVTFIRIVIQGDDEYGFLIQPSVINPATIESYPEPKFWLFEEEIKGEVVSETVEGHWRRYRYAPFGIRDGLRPDEVIEQGPLLRWTFTWTGYGAPPFNVINHFKSDNFYVEVETYRRVCVVRLWQVKRALRLDHPDP